MLMCDLQFRCSRSGYGSQQNGSIGEIMSNIPAKLKQTFHPYI
jgi:hypothetical protein